MVIEINGNASGIDSDGAFLMVVDCSIIDPSGKR
jgi:hypothetical protein